MSMRKYLLHHDGKGRVIEIDNAATSAEAWGKIETDFATEARDGRPAKGVWDSFADAISLYPDQITPNGIPYQMELAGPGGGWYRLLCMANETPDAIKAAQAWLRQSFDVVRQQVLRVTLMAEGPTA